jgi:hypothetical protein
MGSIRHLGRALALALLLTLAACGGTSAPGSDPGGTVQAAMAAATAGGFAKLTDYVCAAKKGDITSTFGGSSLTALASSGVNAQQLMDAMTISFENVATKEVSKTDTTATVHVTGNMKALFDKDKMRAIMKTVLAARGAPTDDATLDAAMTMISGQLSQTQALDNDLKLVKEDGKWLICE